MSSRKQESEDKRERKRLEEELFTEHQFLSVILDSLPMAIYVCKAQGDFCTTYISSKALELTGYRPEQFTEDANFWKERVHPEDSAKVFAEFSKVLKDGHGQVQYRFRVADGSYRYFYDSSRLIRLPGYSEDSFLGIWLDVHKKVLAEARHKETELQLIKAQKMEAIARLAGGVAHDVNNALAAGTLLAEIAMDKLLVDPEQTRESLQRLLMAQKTAGAIIRQLLSFSKPSVSSPATIDFVDVVSSLSPLLKSMLREDIELQIRCAHEPILILADRSQIEQVVINLVINARDAMPAGGKVTLTLESHQLEEIPSSMQIPIQPGCYAVLIARDTGCGMSNEIIQHIFEPFFTTKEVGKGTGMGLAVVYGILQQSGGSVSVESTPGSGTLFHVYWPVDSQNNPQKL